MKRFLKILFSLALLHAGIAGLAQLTQAALERSLRTGDLRHPYLLFDREGKEKILENIREDRTLKEIYERQLAEAYRFVRMPLEPTIPPQGDRSRFYQENELRNYMSRHAGAALNLAFVYQMTGDPEYARHAFNHAEMLCKLESWVYPFHEFPQIYDRVWPWNVDDDQVVFSFDLQSARIATHLALVYDWIYDAMDKGQRDRIRGALLEKAVTRVRGNEEYHWWSTAYRCNWCGICYSGAALASLALLTEDPGLTDLVAGAHNGVSAMLDQLGEDGEWQEGRGYWAYGLGHSMWFMDALKRMTSGQVDLFRHPKVRGNPAAFPLYTMPVNFADGRGGPVGDSWFINKLVRETGDVTAAWYRENFIENEESIYDLIWPDPGIAGREPAAKSIHFKGIDWAVMQSSFFSGPSFSITCKAGLNDDPHHGHLDCGHFILNYRGENFIADPQKSAYDDYYFSAERWDYVVATSRGHNVVSVNGEQQIPAKEKDMPWKEGIGGRIDEFFTSATSDRTTMAGLEKAYPGVEMKSWTRTIILEKPSVAVVADLVGTVRDASVCSRIHPGGETTVEEGYFTIRIGEESLAVVPFGREDVRIATGRHASLSVNERSGFTWIPYVDLVTRAAGTRTPETRTLVGYLVFPCPGERETGAVLRSVRLRDDGKESAVSFTLSGKEYNVALFSPDGE